MKSGGVIAHTAARLLAADTNDPSVRPSVRPASEGAELKMMAAEQLWRGGREGPREGGRKEEGTRIMLTARGVEWRGERTLFFVVAHIKDDGRLENAICIN